jgi:hypothetical protein
MENEGTVKETVKGWSNGFFDAFREVILTLCNDVKKNQFVLRDYIVFFIHFIPIFHYHFGEQSVKLEVLPETKGIKFTIAYAGNIPIKLTWDGFLF